MQSASHLGEELKGHLPFTIFAAAAAMLLAGMLTYVAILMTPAQREAAHGPAATQAAAHDEYEESEAHHEEHRDHEAAAGDPHVHVHGTGHAKLLSSASGGLFHVFHPLHMLLSAIATTAMFWRHDRKVVKAILTGIVGSIGICGISDVGLPYLSGLLLGVDMHFHWCILEHPMLVIPFMLVGVLTGLIAASAVEHATQFSHAGHVFVSSTASILYLISFGLVDWVAIAGYVFIVVVIAVVVPCCLSDIVFPLLVADREGLGSCPDRRHLHRHRSDDPAEQRKLH